MWLTAGPRFENEMLRSVAIGEAAWFVSRKALHPAGFEMIVVPVALGGRNLGSLGAIGPATIRTSCTSHREFGRNHDRTCRPTGDYQQDGGGTTK